MNRLDSLKRTFSYMEKSKLLPDEIIIVDQTQEKEIASKIENLCSEVHLNTRYFWNSEPSLTKARNTGFALTQGDVVVFMDDDVDVREDTFVNVKELFKNENLVMAGGVNEQEDISKLSYRSVLFGLTSFAKRRIGHVTPSIYGRFPIECAEETPSEWAMGFFFAVRKSAVEGWNLQFDEHLKYYAYAEDLDFSYSLYLKAKKENKSTIVSTKLTVRHNVSKEYRIPTQKQTYMMILHRRYIGAKLMAGWKSRILCLWSDLGTFLYRLTRKEPALDIVRAYVFYLTHRKDIVEGNFHYEYFMN